MTRVTDPFDHAAGLRESLDFRRGSLDAVFNPDVVDWINNLGVRVDERPFDWDTHKYLTQPYRETTPVVVIQKAAQMGFSVWAMIRMLHRTLVLAPIKVGYFLPTGPKAMEFSQDRFDKLCRSIPRLSAIYSKGKVQNITMKQYAGSTVFFTHTSGTVTTESTPMDYLIFDEVRKMYRPTIAIARERLSHSQYKFIDYISTAGYPDDDINYYFKRSCQYEWWLRCPACNTEFLPHDDWENLRHVGQRRVNGKITWALQCHKCGHWNIDPQDNGRWVATDRTRPWAGYHISQLASKYINLNTVMEEWFGAENRAEFYRSKLGQPFVDAESILVQQEHLDACVDQDARWGSSLGLSSNGIRRGMDQVVTVMGVDQQQGYNVHVVKEIQPNGRRVLRHLEYSYDKTPFNRTAELMREYDADVVVVDAEPNFNDATAFCHQFRGRAWMAYYSTIGADDQAMVVWHDRIQKGEVPSSKEARMPWHCTIDRVKGMEWSLLQFAARRNAIPNPQGLTQEMRPRDLLNPAEQDITSGRMVVTAICADVYMKHMQRVAKERVASEAKSGSELVARAKYSFVHIGIDPHFAHANLYADIAGVRAIRLHNSEGKPEDLWYKAEQAETPSSQPQQVIAQIAPGIKVGLYDLTKLPPTIAVCDNCQRPYAFEDTRAAGEGRWCLNCLGGRRAVEPIAEKRMRPYMRRRRDPAMVESTPEAQE